ncbi:MAG: bifunctional adenosylcobinamide kinase/adenosylcobinamide-phosphate guanylyltransferase [Sediminimonas qiaohouensis]|uniref:Bifunctional adenosylcobalamin biosynthesis protein n=1 Tax=Sediminimonas qiaohouensis TaxID=552061 RepID=A0A7C9M7P1_9RHOB|nr:bifunctional adenosylcobinamide kinase/adenosylcobinamide-phosphate guanylyltransferase [Sediminimonas qiaohouensis]MTJ03781.1 bifunctional adenosylcobinamide kinase/adenosylcobinamide-phosphate guanylyltransferase [Sediminimonas qiaohouensis]
MLSKLTLVLGGAASGKTAFAESLVKSTEAPMVYLATAQALDDEMKARISAHQATRGPGWHVVEAPLNAADALRDASADSVVLLDCATMWLSNQMGAEGSDLARAQADLLDALTECAARVVVVSNELGQSVVPENALARRFRDAQGALNQQIAARADLVVAVMAGLPLPLKGVLPGGGAA